MCLENSPGVRFYIIYISKGKSNNWLKTMKYFIKSNSLSKFIINQLVYILHFLDEYAAERITCLFAVRSSIQMFSFEIRTD